MAKKKKNISPEQENLRNEQIKGNIENLQGNISNLLSEIDSVDDLMPDGDDFLPDLDLSKVQIFDYEKEMESIKIDAKDTLRCLANLYLDEEIMKDKNVNLIIKDDANKISELNFSISISKRALVKLMEQIDYGTTNAELYKSVFEAQREMRETVKSAHDLLNVKMKKFYQELKEEIEEKKLNTGEGVTEMEDELNVINVKKLNALIDEASKNEKKEDEED